MSTNDRPVCGVGAVIIDDGRLLLIRRKHAPGANLWAVPGGKVRYGETMVDAVTREVTEETGLEVEVGKAFWVGESLGPGDPPSWHYCLVDFLATVTGGAPRPGDDAVEMGWFTTTEARRMPLTATMYELLDLIEGSR